MERQKQAKDYRKLRGKGKVLDPPHKRNYDIIKVVKGKKIEEILAVLPQKGM